MHVPYSVCHVAGVGRPPLRRDRLHQQLPAGASARGPPRVWSRRPSTRRRAGAGSTGAGSPPRGRTCWSRSSCAPGATPGTSTCAPPPWPWRPPTPAGTSPRSSPAQVAQRPAGRRVQAGRDPGGGRFLQRAPPPSWSGSASTWPGPVRREPGGTCLDDVGGSPQPVDPGSCSSASSSALGAGGPPRRGGRAGRPGRGAAPALRHAGPAGPGDPRGGGSRGRPRPSTTPASSSSTPRRGPEAWRPATSSTCARSELRGARGRANMAALCAFS